MNNIMKTTIGNTRVICILISVLVYSCTPINKPTSVSTNSIVPTDLFKGPTREPAYISLYPNIIHKDLDELIKGAELIVKGNVIKLMPSKWNTDNGLLPEYISNMNISPKYYIYTDVLFSIINVQKGNSSTVLVRIRQVGGKVGQVTMVDEVEPYLQLGTQYLLFLFKDTWPNIDDDNVIYNIFGSMQGIFTIDHEKAESINIHMELVDLEKYIKDSIE